MSARDLWIDWFFSLHCSSIYWSPLFLSFVSNRKQIHTNLCKKMKISKGWWIKGIRGDLAQVLHHGVLRPPAASLFLRIRADDRSSRPTSWCLQHVAVWVLKEHMTGHCWTSPCVEEEAVLCFISLGGKHGCGRRKSCLPAFPIRATWWWVNRVYLCYHRVWAAAKFVARC